VFQAHGKFCIEPATELAIELSGGQNTISVASANTSQKLWSKDGKPHLVIRREIEQNVIFVWKQPYLASRPEVVTPVGQKIRRPAPGDQVDFQFLMPVHREVIRVSPQAPRPPLEPGRQDDSRFGGFSDVDSHDSKK
jgi:hypothetical protein